MLDRTSYTLSDLLLFSARVYERMFELHNLALWPIHLLALAIGACLLVVALKPSPPAARSVSLLLAIVWLFVAWAFFFERYATINWAAVYVVPFFVLEAMLLGFLAVRAKSPLIANGFGLSRMVALAVLLFSFVGYPFVSRVIGGSWQAAEVFAIAPDPTVTATLALLAMGRGGFTWLAAIVPLLWVIVTSLTLWTLGSPEFAIAPLAALACGAAYLARH